jgi:hypothetical protein
MPKVPMKLKKPNMKIENPTTFSFGVVNPISKSRYKGAKVLKQKIENMKNLDLLNNVEFDYNRSEARKSRLAMIKDRKNVKLVALSSEREGYVLKKNGLAYSEIFNAFNKYNKIDLHNYISDYFIKKKGVSINKSRVEHEFYMYFKDILTKNMISKLMPEYEKNWKLKCSVLQDYIKDRPNANFEEALINRDNYFDKNLKLYVKKITDKANGPVVTDVAIKSIKEAVDTSNL